MRSIRRFFRELVGGDPPGDPEWSLALAETAVDGIDDSEKELLLRVAEARGRRVPVSELSTALGLPAAPALEQDFPTLSKFCFADDGTDRPPMPVVSGGSGGQEWYWMSYGEGNLFRRALLRSARVNAA